LHIGNELSVVSKVKRSSFTVDKRECLESWPLDGKQIKGCTNLPDPDGNSNGYWCRTLEPSAEES